MAHSHYAYLETEALIGTTLELIERPVERMPPEKVHPRSCPMGCHDSAFQGESSPRPSPARLAHHLHFECDRRRAVPRLRCYLLFRPARRSSP